MYQVILTPGRVARLMYVPEYLLDKESLRLIVGGEPETVRVPSRADVVIIIRKDGQDLGLPINARATRFINSKHNTVTGVAVVLGVTEGRYHGLEYPAAEKLLHTINGAETEKEKDPG